jgi:uncharacterized repeat protein (TIGR03803 family)
VQGTDGYFYGTTHSGGTNGVISGGYGTVFKMRSDGTMVWSFSLNGTNGDTCRGGLVQANDGNFYGTTVFGGTRGGKGTVFRITPNGVLTTLYSFTGLNDGYQPNADLIQGADGSLYGTTVSAGTNFWGSVYKITTNGVFTPLYSFGAVTNSAGQFLDGVAPNGGLALGIDGALYGTTYGGGPYTNADGTVFKISPTGALTTLHYFVGGTNEGSKPQAQLVQGLDGAFYGTTIAGGQYGFAGTAFRITTNGNFTTIHRFSPAEEGYEPNGLARASDGNFYGTTQKGSKRNWGAVFRMSPSGVTTTIYSFGSITSPSYVYPVDGVLPYLATVAQGSDGNLYGTTQLGGNSPDNYYGTAFRLSVPMAPVGKTFTIENSMLRWKWTSIAGQAYQLQYSTNLDQPSWDNLGSSFVATNGTITTSDPIQPQAQRFYRLVLLP